MSYLCAIQTQIKKMNISRLWMLAAILTISGTGLQAQTKRSDDFRAKYELKEVVVMSRHNIRSPLSSGGAAYQRDENRRPRQQDPRSSLQDFQRHPHRQLIPIGGVLSRRRQPTTCGGEPSETKAPHAFS